MNHQEFFFNHSNTKLFGQYWKPDTYKAVVLLVHGMGEHSTRYTSYVIPTLTNNKIAVITFDNFGHGKSNGKRGHTPSYSVILEVINIMIAKAKTIFETAPIFLYGHSMGGNLVINHVLKEDIKIRGAVVTSPFLKLAFEPPKIKIMIGKLLQKIAPSFILKTGLNTKALSKDINAITAYKEDRLVHDKISPNFSFPFMEAGIWALDNASSLSLPMLLFHGKKDAITAYSASQLFSKATNKVTLELFEDGFHELHNDIEKTVLLEKIIAWIDKHI